MKRVVTILMMTFCFWDYSWAGYVDHRGHNLLLAHGTKVGQHFEEIAKNG